MSAWVVAREHIDVLVKAGLDGARLSRIQGHRMGWWRVDGEGGFLGWRYLGFAWGDADTMTPDELGQMLTDECVESVRYRYPLEGESDYELPGHGDYIEPYAYTDPRFTPTAGEVFKAIDCYSYQSCEHPGWLKSEAHAYCRSLANAWQNLVDGYEAAPWGWDAAQVAKRRGATASRTR